MRACSSCLQWRGPSPYPSACAQLLTLCVSLAFAHRAGALGCSQWGFCGAEVEWLPQLQGSVSQWALVHVCRSVCVCLAAAWPMGLAKAWAVWRVFRGILTQTQPVSVLTCSRLVALVAYIQLVAGAAACGVNFKHPGANGGCWSLICMLRARACAGVPLGRSTTNAVVWLAVMPGEFFSPAIVRTHTGPHVCRSKLSCLWRGQLPATMTGQVITKQSSCCTYPSQHGRADLYIAHTRSQMPSTRTQAQPIMHAYSTPRCNGPPKPLGLPNSHQSLFSRRMTPPSSSMRGGVALPSCSAPAAVSARSKLQQVPPLVPRAHAIHHTANRAPTCCTFATAAFLAQEAGRPVLHVNDVLVGSSRAPKPYT